MEITGDALALWLGIAVSITGLVTWMSKSLIAPVRAVTGQIDRLSREVLGEPAALGTAARPGLAERVATVGEKADTAARVAAQAASQQSEIADVVLGKPGDGHNNLKTRVDVLTSLVVDGQADVLGIKQDVAAITYQLHPNDGGSVSDAVKIHLPAAQRRIEAKVAENGEDLRAQAADLRAHVVECRDDRAAQAERADLFLAQASVILDKVTREHERATVRSRRNDPYPSALPALDAVDEDGDA